MKRCIQNSIAAAFLMLAGVAGAQNNYGSYDSYKGYRSDWTSDWEEPYTVQALLGAMQFENLQFDDTSGDGGDPVEVDLSLIPQLGGAWATPAKGEHIQFGLECSFLLGFQFDSVSGYAGGSGLYIKLESSMWMFDLAGGPYLNIPLGEWGRIYGAGGPLLMYADYRTERKEDDGLSSEKYNDSESAFGVGLYARTGIEFRVHERGYLGLGARGLWANIDLSSVGGANDLSGIGAFVTYTAGL